MKLLILFFLFLLPRLAFSAETPLRWFKFVEATKTKQSDGLPPKLEVTFDLMCNEEFVKVIRNEWIDPKSKRTSIAVGVLVKENPYSSCAGVKKKMTVDAGTTFSGREFEVTRIKK